MTSSSSTSRKRAARFGLFDHARTISTEQLEAAGLLPIVSGTDVKPYAPLQIRQAVIFPYDVEAEVATLKSWSRIQRNTPQIARYLSRHRSTLAARERYQFDDDQWYRFGRNQNIGIQGRPKLCIPRLVARLNGTIDEAGRFCFGQR